MSENTPAEDQTPLPCGLDVSKPACRPPVYCIGDSHVSLFSGARRIQPIWPCPVKNRIPAFESKRLGAVLAYSLSRWDTTLRGREILFTILDRGLPEEAREVPFGSRVLLCFGEIDCRYHIPRQAEKTALPVEEVARSTAETYYGVVREVRDLGYDVTVWGPGPSKIEEGAWGRYPSIGPMEERNATTLEFTAVLSELVSERGDAGVRVVSITDQLIDEHLATRTEFLGDRAHVGRKAIPMMLESVGEALGWLQVCRRCPVALELAESEAGGAVGRGAPGDEAPRD